MTTTWKRTLWGLATAVAALSGCGAVDAPGAPGALQQGETVAAQAALPSCDAVAQPSGAVAVEEIAGGQRMVVRAQVGDLTVAVCEGTFDEVVTSGVLGHKNDGPLIPVFADPAASDPMPADGRHDADSDPMPAHGAMPRSAGISTHR